VIPFRTGNLSVWRLHAARHGAPPPDPREERELLPQWRALGFDAVEDYVAWQVCEPQPGRWDFAHHRANAQAAAHAGLQYVIYPWAHALPPWWREGPDCVLARCVEHGRSGALPSLWAPSTWGQIERLWRALAEALREHVQGVAVAFPADYGEAAHGAGVADWILGLSEHQHAGLWCDEEPARAAWREAVRARHGSPAALAAAWALPDAWEAPPLPGAEASLVHRADFARFLRGAVEDGARRLLALARELFPDVPRELKLGHCSEALELGADWHELVAVAAAAGATVCFTGAAQGELFTRRVGTLCRDLGAPLATEAPREIPVWLLPGRAFADVAAGARELFEFPEQLAAARPAFDAVRPALGRTPLRPAVGCVYATTDLGLQPGHGVPDALAHAFAPLRRVCDLDLLDERQIAEGRLAGLPGLLWLDGVAAPRAALLALAEWVHAGGTLIASTPQAPQPLDEHGAACTLDGAAAQLLALLAPAEEPLRLRGELPESSIELRPGESEARLLLGAGWHGREDGRWAFPGAVPPSLAGDGRGAVPLDHWTEPGETPPLPCRWTSALAELLLPVPPALRRAPAGGELRLELFVPPAAAREPLRLWLGGVELPSSQLRGRQLLVRALPGVPRADFVQLRLQAPTHRPAHGGSTDRRELGVLVLGAALVGPAGGPGAGLAALLDSQRTWRASGEPVPFGAGAVLRGDGTPLAALAWLNAWLAGEVAGAPLPPDPPRDALQGCLVAALHGGLLVHNPHPVSAARPQLLGARAHATRRLTTWNSLRPWSLLAPLQTRFVE
jgi:hypothetical protein